MISVVYFDEKELNCGIRRGMTWLASVLDAVNLKFIVRFPLFHSLNVSFFVCVCGFGPMCGWMGVRRLFVYILPLTFFQRTSFVTTPPPYQTLQKRNFELSFALKWGYCWFLFSCSLHPSLELSISPMVLAGEWFLLSLSWVLCSFAIISISNDWVPVNDLSKQLILCMHASNT